MEIVDFWGTGLKEMLQGPQKPSRLISMAYKYLSQLTSPFGSTVEWGRTGAFQDSGPHRAAEARKLLPIAVDLRSTVRGERLT